MADIEESVENVDSPFSGQDFSDFDPPPPEFLLAMMQKLTGLTDVDRKELMQKLLTQEFLQGQEPVGLVRQLLSSQLFVLLTLSSVTATVFASDTETLTTKRTHLHECLSYKINNMATEDVHGVTVAGGGNYDAMGKKLLELWSRLNEHMSPEAKSQLKDILKQYKELSDPEKKDFDENLKQQLSDHVTYATRNRFLSEIMNNTLLVVCAATVFLLFVFFGYKLYKSLKEKERKRDEKKKLRQQKKKK